MAKPGTAVARLRPSRLLAHQVDGFIILGDSNEIRPSLSREIGVPVHATARLLASHPDEVGQDDGMTLPVPPAAAGSR